MMQESKILQIQIFSFLSDVHLCDVLLDKLELEDIEPLAIQRYKHNAARDFIRILSAIFLILRQTLLSIYRLLFEINAMPPVI